MINVTVEWQGRACKLAGIGTGILKFFLDFLDWKMLCFLWKNGFWGVYIPSDLILFLRVLRSACRLGQLWLYRSVVFVDHPSCIIACYRNIYIDKDR